MISSVFGSTWESGVLISGVVTCRINGGACLVDDDGLGVMGRPPRMGLLLMNGGGCGGV